MPVAPRLLDLSAEEFIDLRIDCVQELGLTVFKSVHGELFSIKNDIHCDEKREISKYFVSACYTGHSGESQVGRLLSRTNGRTLGYIFPMTSFRNESNFDGTWAKRFADVGFRWMSQPQSLTAFATGASVSSIKGASLFLDEVVSDEISVLVVGYENLQSAEIPIATLELILLGDKIHLLESLPAPFPSVVSSTWRQTFHLRRLSDLAVSDSEIFAKLIKSADRDANGLGAFIQLYQILEFCIDLIFNWEVERISRQGYGTWELRENLAKIAGEKHRLGYLHSNCMPSFATHTILDAMKAECVSFLSKLDIIIDSGVSPLDALYRVRNIVIHNQISLLRSRSAALDDVVLSLRDVCFEVLFCFSRPEDREESAFNAYNCLLTVPQI